MKTSCHLQICFAFIATIAGADLFAQSTQFRLIRKTVIGGDGGWDYLSVDPVNRRLYISHSTQVEVLNADTHEKVGVIPNLKGVHGVIAVPETGRGVTTNGKSNSATIFDLKTLEPIVELPTGENPDALLFDGFSKRIFIFNHSDVTATVIDIAEGTVVGTIDLGGTALEAGTSDGKGTIFVNLEEDSKIVSFDARTLVVKNRWTVSPGEEPTGLAIDVKTKRLFAVCGNKLMIVLDAEKGNVVAQVPIGVGTDGVVFDANLGMAFSSNGEGNISVVKEASANEFKVIQTIKTEPGARTIAIDQKTHHIFVSTAQLGPAPTATTANPHPRPSQVPGTFMILEFAN